MESHFLFRLKSFVGSTRLVCIHPLTALSRCLPARVAAVPPCRIVLPVLYTRLKVLSYCIVNVSSFQATPGEPRHLVILYSYQCPPCLSRGADLVVVQQVVHRRVVEPWSPV